MDGIYFIIIIAPLGLPEQLLPQLFLTLEDLTGTVEVVVFPRVFREAGELLERDRAILVTGRTNSVETSSRFKKGRGAQAAPAADMGAAGALPADEEEAAANRDNGEGTPEIKVIAEAIVALGGAPAPGGEGQRKLFIRLNGEDPAKANEDLLDAETRHILNSHPGGCDLILFFAGTDDRRTYRGSGYRVDGSEELVAELKARFGSDNVRFGKSPRR